MRVDSESDVRLKRHLLEGDGARLLVGNTFVTVRLNGSWCGSLDTQPFWITCEDEKDEQGNWLRIPQVRRAVQVVGRAQIAAGMERLGFDREAVVAALADGDWLEAMF